MTNEFEYKRTLLISEDTLKGESIISDNVDMKILVPTIELVQDIYLQPIIGTKLLDGLKQRIYSDTLSSDDKLLLEMYIEKVIVYGVLSEGSTPLVYKYMNKSIAKSTSDTTENATLEEVRYLFKKYADRMQWYLTRLDDFLCAYVNSYPEFRESRFPDVVPNGRTYQSAIYLGNKGRQGKTPNRYKRKDRGGHGSIETEL